VTDRWRRVPWAVQDALAAVALGLLWLAVYRYARGHGWYPRYPDTYVLAGVWSVVAVALRRLVPWPLLVVTVAAYPLLYEPELQTEFHLLPVLIAAYAATNTDRIRSVGAAVLAMVAVLTLSTNQHRLPLPPDIWAHILFNEFTTAGVVLLGVLVHEQRRTAVTLAARNAELERLRAVESAQVVAAERTRIARELHDVVAHHLTALIIRAQAADRVSTTQPEVAVESMGWMATTAKEALDAMRQTVHVLREEQSLAPGPSLADLPGIAERVRAAGLDVDLRVPAALPVVDAQVELAAVRIAQEALTNVLRHAAGTRAVVALRPVEGGLWVEVDDDGRGELPPTPTGGHGLLGMRERAVSCGGRLGIERSPLGGWRIRAWLPEPA
jgi:signal transduction histidine kinase